MLIKTHHSFIVRLGLISILIAGMLGIQPAHPVRAATLVVTNTNDSGAGSLRQAIANANSGDTITFHTSLAGQTITLASTLFITKNLTIDGSALASPIAISGVTGNDGTGNSRVFNIDFNVNATLKGLTITKSEITGYPNSGGIEIYNNAVLTIIDCTITNNSNGNGGGILNWYGTLIMENSIVANNSAISGGGIYSQGGSMTLTDVVITNNLAEAAGFVGGGIHNAGNLEIINSTISNNSGEGIDNQGSLVLTNSIVKENLGRGIFNDLYSTMEITNTLIRQNEGGGIYNQGSATITGSTFHGNSSLYGGGIVNTHTLTVTNSTFFGNQADGYDGGAITDSGTLTVVNSTFSGNTANSGGGIYSTSNPTIRNSILWGNTGGEIVISPHWEYGNVTHSIVQGGYPGTEIMDADPLLGTLANNGGFTQTMALDGDSPAINAGDDENCPATDQRGVTRPRGSHCDIGAYEKIFHYVKRNANGTNTGTSWTNAYTNLQSALSVAASGDEIWVAAGTYKPTTGTDRTISFALKNGVAIYGGFAGTETLRTQRNPVANVTILSGDIGVTGNTSDNSYHVVSSEDTDDMTILDGFTVTAGNANGSSPYNNGGGLFNKNSDLILQNMIFQGNIASTNGGGLYNTGSNSTLVDVTFRGNSASNSGAGVYNTQSSPIFINITLNENSAGYSGGGISNYSSHPLLINVTFNSNLAGTYGGGLAQSFSNPTLINVTFSGNSASVSGGGGITNDASNPTIINTILYGNMGGEIRNFTGSSPQVTYSAVQGGHAGIGNISVDPLLGSLQDNGGFTQTMALGADSPAIDAGDDVNCPDIDQRGIARPQGIRCDIGAYEVKGPIAISISGTELGFYSAVSNQSKRVSLVGINNGPVKIVHNDNATIIAAERVIYKVKGVNTSFTELMGLPEGQLDNVYWLPWYNNVNLDTQLRIANATNNPATVTVTIGGEEMPPLNLAGGESTRVSYDGVNDGPVKIESDQDIVAAERVIYTVQGVQTSFSELMALPNSQLDNIYWLPWYNNTALDTQLRIGNVSDSTATVHIFIGRNEVTPVEGITLLAGDSTRVSYPVNDGPVKIVSDRDIVAAERVIYKVNGVFTSFSEMMALPNSQLDNIYWLPWYNNTGLDTQLRIGNVSGSTATVHIFIGGNEVTPVEGITLLDGESTRVSYPVNDGPVQIMSDQDIVAAERVIYKVNNLQTSFSEMMALPESQLDATYWFPWYNNIRLDTQLRFGVP